MLSLAFGLLLIAAVLGSVLAAMHLRGRSPPRLWLGVVHALLGGTGFVALLFALRGPPRGAAMGVAEFGRIGAVLLALALLVGLVVFVLRVRRRASGLVMGIHASIAIKVGVHTEGHGGGKATEGHGEGAFESASREARKNPYLRGPRWLCLPPWTPCEPLLLPPCKPPRNPLHLNQINLPQRYGGWP